MLTTLLFTMVVRPALDEKRPIKFPVTIEDSGFQGGVFDVGACLVTGQPTEASFRKLASEGYKTVICLREQYELDNRQWVPFDEPALLKELGMELVMVPIGEANPAAVKKFAETLNRAQGKVLLHCTIAWRASYMWMAYLVTERGMTIDEAWKNGMAMNVTVDRTARMLGQEVSYMAAPRTEQVAKPMAGIVSASSSRLKISAPTVVFPPDPNNPTQFVMWDMGDVLNAGQPDEAKLRDMHATGVRTIVNLRTPEEMEEVKKQGFDEEATAKSLGIKYVQIPIRNWRDFSPEALASIAKAFDEAEGRILYHCRTASRTTEALVPYLIKYQGMDINAATQLGRSMRGTTSMFEDFLGVEFNRAVMQKPLVLLSCG